MQEIRNKVTDMGGKMSDYDFMDNFKPLRHTHSRLQDRYHVQSLDKLMEILDELRDGNFRDLIKMLRGRKVVEVAGVVAIVIYKTSTNQWIPITVLAEHEEVWHQDGTKYKVKELLA